jgi:HlyD family secretion protein
MKTVIKLSLLIVLVLGVLGTYKAINKSETKSTTFRTTAVTRGDLVTTIESTGTVEPEKVVDVGSQVSGQIISFGTDSSGKPIDYGSEVEEGMLLAKIDDALCQADVNEAKVSMQSAEAGIAKAKADLEQLKSKYEQAKCDWERAQKIGGSKALSQTSYDGYKFSYLTAKANVSVGEAAVLEAEATLATAKTSLWRAERNLGYCTITSPIKGVIIDRRVNIGQTVISSMSTSSLFLLAKDLKKMQVWVAVNEADIGKIHPGQRVTFKVDAFPGETFRGEVGKVRLNACMTQNVVTYTVEISTDNSSGRLLPYLTADVEFELERHDNVLQISSAALRWSPSSAAQVSPEFRNEFASLVSPEYSGKIVWIVDKPFVKPIKVKTGLTNGIVTEISGEGIREKLKVVLGLETSKTGAAGEEASADESENDASSQNEAANNPFTPKMPKPPKGMRPPH